MPRPPSATVSDLLALLRGEPAPAAWLVQQMGVTRPVLSRLVADWEACTPCVATGSSSRPTATARI